MDRDFPHGQESLGVSIVHSWRDELLASGSHEGLVLAEQKRIDGRGTTKKVNARSMSTHSLPEFPFSL